MKLRTLNKRIATKVNGVFYKEVIDDKNKVVDKVFLIRYRDQNKDKLVTIGKYSQGIRINYCKKKRDEILNIIRLGEVPTTIKAKRVDKNVVTFNMIANNYFEYAKLHNRTYHQTRLMFNMHVEPILGDMDMYAVKLEDIEQIQKDKIKTLSPRSVNSLIQVINTIYNFAISRNIFEKINPVSKVKALKMDNNREKFLTLEEIKKLEDEIKDDRQLTLFVKLALCTGGRVSSIVNIRKKDINLATQVVNLKDFKMGTTYKAFIPDNLVDMLAKRLREIKNDDEVINVKGCKSLRSNIDKAMPLVLNKLFNQGLDKNDRKNRTVIHTLRHTFASHLAINGTPIFTIQKLLNHKDIAMTMRYAKLAPDSGRVQVNELYK